MSDRPDNDRHDPDDSPVLLVHPDDFSLPEVKAKAASLGVSVQPSALVPRGQSFVYDPRAAKW